MSKEREYLDQGTDVIVSEYLKNICSYPDFLCANKERCKENSPYYGTLENIEKICNGIKTANICTNNVDTCQVSAKSKIPGTDTNVVTTFMNIIIPIKGAFDDQGNQKFLRLPPLSGSKEPGTDEICNSCACIERFAKSPGTGNTDYTAPGQNLCVFSDTLEYYYYPLRIENISQKLTDEPDIVLDGIKIINANIIYSNNSEDLKPDRLYDILIKNGIIHSIAYNFITSQLYKNNIETEKILNLHLSGKKLDSELESKKGVFLKNIVSFYIILIAFIILIIFNLSI